jgi:hypothetical protein
VAAGQIAATYSDTGIVLDVEQTQTANVQVAFAASDGSVPDRREISFAPVLLHGITSTTANGPATLSTSGGSATISFTGIKDSGGNLVPDGTVVLVSAADSATFTNCCFVRSSGGTIVDGSPSSSGVQWKAFVVQHGTVTVTYSPSGASVGTASIQMVGGKPDGSIVSRRVLDGGVWTINITN